MRHKLKKEALDVIVQKIANDASGVFLTDLIKIANAVRGKGTQGLNTTECQLVLRNVKWLYGYEEEILKALETIKSMLEKKIFNKEAAHVTIISCMSCYSVLLSIFDISVDADRWYEPFESCENNRLKECLEILKRHCPKKLDVDGFVEARRYIRIWDSAYNW